jgi:hypothetical protein
MAQLLAAWSCDQEDARVRAHLEDAFNQLVTAPPRLTPAQQDRRATALAALRRYIDRGRFPRNTTREPATPVFVDETGTHCAMGALLSELGGDVVVEHVRATRNLARVPELADEPGLVEWLDANGVAPEEAALVQPTYFSCTPVLELRWTSAIYEGVVVATDAGSDLGLVATSSVAGHPVCPGDLQEDFVMRPAWPINTLVTAPDLLARDDQGWTAPQYRNCAWRPVLGDAQRQRMLDLVDPTAQVELFEEDPRWFIIQCHHNFGAPDLDFCSSDGRFRSEVLPPRGSMRDHVLDWFGRAAQTKGLPPPTPGDLADAGVDLAVIDAIEGQVWAFSDDGGQPLSASVGAVAQWTGALPQPISCTGGGPDAGAADAGTVDAGSADAGAPDAGAPDAGTPGAGTPGAGAPDAGAPDAGAPDAVGREDSGGEGRGCGCGSAPMGMMLMAAGLMWNRRQRGQARAWGQPVRQAP